MGNQELAGQKRGRQERRQFGEETLPAMACRCGYGKVLQLVGSKGRDAARTSWRCRQRPDFEDLWELRIHPEGKEEPCVSLPKC